MTDINWSTCTDCGTRWRLDWQRDCPTCATAQKQQAVVAAQGIPDDRLREIARTRCPMHGAGCDLYSNVCLRALARALRECRGLLKDATDRYVETVARAEKAERERDEARKAKVRADMRYSDAEDALRAEVERLHEAAERERAHWQRRIARLREALDDAIGYMPNITIRDKCRSVLYDEPEEVSDADS